MQYLLWMLLIRKELKKLGLKEHLQDDNFEEFLRNKLNEFDGEPNNNMWDRVDSVIPPPPKPMLFRIMKPSAIAASMVLAVAVFAAVYQYSSKQNLNEQLIEATDKIKELENKIDKEVIEETVQLEEIEAIEDAKEKNNTINQNETPDLNSNKLTESDKSNVVSNSKKPSFQSKTNRNNKSSKNPSSNINDRNQTPIANDNIINKNNDAQKQLDNNKLDKTPIANDNTIHKNDGTQKQLNNNKVNKTPIADNKINHSSNTTDNQPKDKLKQSSNEKMALSEPFPLERIRNSSIDNYSYIIMVEQKPSIEKPTFKPRLIVGGFAHSFQTKPEFRERPGPVPAGGNPFKDHRLKPATGLATGVKVGLQLNSNWSIHSGLAYQQEKIDMKLIDHRDYIKDRENDIGNNRESYRDYYRTHSPFGEILIDGRFTKDKDEYIENKPFDIEIDGTHQLTSLNIPLYFQVQDQKGRFIYGLKAGIYGRRILDNSFEATEITSSISELKASEVTVLEQPEISHKWNADLLSGVVLAYKHNSHVTISLEPTALVSLGNKHESQYGRTKMKSFGSQLAVQYTF